MSAEAARRASAALGREVRGLRPLSGGCVGEVYRAELDAGDPVVVKVDRSRDASLDIEGYMLGYLAERSGLPVPRVHASQPDVLVMDFIEGGSRFSNAAEEHAADLLAALHEVRGERFGLERDTLIGGLHQPNPWTDSWRDFFRDRRLLYMAEEARAHGTLPAAVHRKVEQLAARIDEFIDEPAHPSLLHGDVWTTNILARDGRVTAFLDPAVYHGHPEIELAFITLFSTFGQPFFTRYAELRGMAPGFFEERRDIYNLYPLLVHTRLFGGGYANSVDGILSRFGF